MKIYQYNMNQSWISQNIFMYKLWLKIELVWWGNNSGLNLGFIWKFCAWLQVLNLKKNSDSLQCSWNLSVLSDVKSKIGEDFTKDWHKIGELTVVITQLSSLVNVVNVKTRILDLPMIGKLTVVITQLSSLVNVVNVKTRILDLPMIGELIVVFTQLSSLVNVAPSSVDRPPT